MPQNLCMCVFPSTWQPQNPVASSAASGCVSFSNKKSDVQGEMILKSIIYMDEYGTCQRYVHLFRMILHPQLK